MSRHLLSDRLSNGLDHVLRARVDRKSRTWAHASLAVQDFVNDYQKSVSDKKRQANPFSKKNILCLVYTK